MMLKIMNKINRLQVEALGLIPDHLLCRLRGRDSKENDDDVENPLVIMRQSIDDAKKGTNGRLPDNYRPVQPNIYVNINVHIYVSVCTDAIMP
jgi:hypothetical protein